MGPRMLTSSFKSLKERELVEAAKAAAVGTSKVSLQST